MNPKLEDCPFCGQDDEVVTGDQTQLHDTMIGVKLERAEAGFDIAYVICHSCGARGPRVLGRESKEDIQKRAIEAWNDRI